MYKVEVLGGREVSFSPNIKTKLFTFLWWAFQFYGYLTIRKQSILRESWQGRGFLCKTNFMRKCSSRILLRVKSSNVVFENISWFGNCQESVGMNLRWKRTVKDKRDYLGTIFVPSSYNLNLDILAYYVKWTGSTTRQYSGHCCLTTNLEYSLILLLVYTVALVLIRL